MMPSNHRLAERKLIRMVRDGLWSVEPDGRILWRVKMGRSSIAIFDTPRKRIATL